MTSLLHRHPDLAPLISNLNAYYENSDGPGQPSRLYEELRAAWWPLARAKHIASRSAAAVGGRAATAPSQDCRVWPRFFTAYIHSDKIDVLGYAIFHAAVRDVQAAKERRTRFSRVAALLDKAPWETLLWLGADVAMRSNSLKNIARLLASPNDRVLEPEALLRELYGAALERHRNDPAAPPSLTSADVTVVFQRYRPKAASRGTSATPSVASSSHAPSTSVAVAATAAAGSKRRATGPAPESAPEAKRPRRSHAHLSRLDGNNDEEGEDQGPCDNADPDDDDNDEEEEDVEQPRGVPRPDHSPFAPSLDLSPLSGASASIDTPSVSLADLVSAVAEDCGVDADDALVSATARARVRRVALARLVAACPPPSLAEARNAAEAGFWAVFRDLAQQLLDSGMV
ncbi:hypothetical protein F5X98DRAFT_381711 [Xylaria grammica]|nr:hypothetical protein F5X98DRAFT_381711 [Xylaria grammica]